MSMTVLWPDLGMHMPMVSRHWSIGAISGGGISIGTPLLKAAIDINYLRLPLYRRMGGGQWKYKLRSIGAGIEVGVGISLPVINVSGSLDSWLGAGSAVWLGPFSPVHPDLEDFTNYAYVGSVQKTNTGVQGSAVVVIFTKTLAINPFSITAIGVCSGLSSASSFISMGADMICYNIWRNP